MGHDAAHRGTTSRRAWTVALVAVLLLTLAVPASAVRSSRLSGQDRVQTSTNVATATTQHRYRVYLARADDSADALAAGALTDGPVLLVPRCGQVPDDVRAVVDQAGTANEVIALGGTSAICEQMLRDVADGRATARIAGVNRFDTAAQIALRAFPRGAREVYLGNGYGSPDPVAGGVLRDGPMLLVPPTGAVPDVVARAIRTLDPGRVVAVGGTAAIGEDVLGSAAAGRPTGRIAGASRYETAVRLSRYLWGTVPERQTSQPLPAHRAYLARGDVFADALAAGSAVDGPILLVPSCGELPTVVADELGRLRVDEVVALGGTGAVCDTILRAAEAQAPPSGVWFRFSVSQFFTGLHAQAQETVPLAGARVTYGGATGTTDAAGQVRFDVPSQPFQPWSVEHELLVAAHSSSQDFQDCEFRGATQDAIVCNVDVPSFIITTGVDHPDGDIFQPPLPYAETIRVVGRDEAAGVEATQSTEPRPDGTIAGTVFFALPPGPYDVFVTREGCAETWMHRGGIRYSGGTGFASLTRQPCQPVGG